MHIINIDSCSFRYSNLKIYTISIYKFAETQLYLEVLNGQTKFYELQILELYIDISTIEYLSSSTTEKFLLFRLMISRSVPKVCILFHPFDFTEYSNFSFIKNANFINEQSNILAIIWMTLETGRMILSPCQTIYGLKI